MAKKKLEVEEVEATVVTEVAVVEQIPTELAEVVEKSGLAISKAMDIFANYVPLMEEVKAKGELLQGLNPENPKDVVLARRVRADLGKINSKAEAQKKSDKAVALAIGRCVDGGYNSVVGPSKLVQAEASAIINYAEEQEKLRIEKLQKEREDLLADIHPHPQLLTSLGSMTDEIWNATFSGLKAEHQSRLDAELRAKEAEERRVARTEMFKPYMLELEELFPDTDIALINEVDLVQVLSDCKESFEAKNRMRIEKEKEAERLKKELELEREKQIKLDAIFSQRLAQLPGVVFDGVNYRPNTPGIQNVPPLVSMAGLKTIDDEAFNNVLEKFNKLNQKYAVATERLTSLRGIDYQIGIDELHNMEEGAYQALFTVESQKFQKALDKALEEKRKADEEAKRIADENAAKLRAIEEQRLAEQKVLEEKAKEEQKLSIATRMGNWVKESQLRFINTATIKNATVKEVTDNIQTKYNEFLAYAEEELKKLP